MNQLTVPHIKTDLAKIGRQCTQAGFDALARGIENAVASLDSPMQLAIIGRISSSKSTLVNAILGKDEVMATGQMEVTYNVGWLKYGNPNSDIIIHYKDRPDVVRKSPTEFKEWSLKADAMSEVSYIEVFDDAEILKSINIIDTPGLDAERKKDSQNTLDFLRQVRPDAVIMLFTHSVAESTLKVIEDFNQYGSFSPLNAIGLQAKIDVSWMQLDDYATERETALSLGTRLTRRKMEREPQIRDNLFKLLPVSSLLFLRSFTIDEGDLAILRKIASIRADLRDDLFDSVADFSKMTCDHEVSPAECESVLTRFGLYGIYLLVTYLTDKPDATVSDARELLYRQSGAEQFMSLLYNHFGLRSSLIKSESILTGLMQCMEKDRKNIEEEQESNLRHIKESLTDLFAPLNSEHDQYHLVKQIYSAEIRLTMEEKAEILALCGEGGYGASQRLSLADGTAPASMLEHINERQKYWRRKMTRDIMTADKRWKQSVIRIYAELKAQIQTIYLQYMEAQAFLFNTSKTI